MGAGDPGDALGVSEAAGTRRLLLDRFHIGVRLGTLAWWLISTLLLYLSGIFLWSLILGSENNWIWLPWLIASLLLSQFLGRWGERQLMQRWPSGRVLELVGPALTLHERAGAHHIDLSKQVSYRRWQFIIRDRRGGRIPAGHLCCAIRLMQDDAVMSLYAFVSPEQAKALGERFEFYEVRPASEMKVPPSPLGGRDAAFLAAEKSRWENGAELEPADFETLLEHLNRYLPNFQAATS